MRLRAAVLLILALGGPRLATPGDEEAAVRAHFAAFAEAWINGDAPAVAAGFAEDGDLVRPNEPPVVGRAAIEAFYARVFQGPLKGATKTTTIDRVRLIGEAVAVVDSSYTLDRDTPPRLRARGASITVLEKRAGKWLTVLSRSYRLP